MTTTAAPHISVHTTPSGRCVQIAGPLTWEQAPAFRAAVSESIRQGQVLIDLTGVTHIDSAGTGALVASFLEADRMGAVMALLTAGELLAIVDRIGIADVLPVFADRVDASAWTEGGSSGAGREHPGT